MTTKIPARMMANTGVTAGSYSAADITVNEAGQITSATSNSVVASGGGSPKISGIAVTDSSYVVLDDTAVSVAGGYIKITGTGFASGCSVIIGNTLASSVTFVSSTQIHAQIPAQTAGTYTVYLTNSDGGVAIRINGVNYSATPTWTTTSPLPGGIKNTAISLQLVATSNSSVTYTLQSGSSLPSGLTLSSSGLLSGTTPDVASETTYNFTVVATDGEAQDTPQAFQITIIVGDPYYELVTLHLPGNGTNLANNNTFQDSSANNFSITRSGNTTQGTFSPFSQTGWGNYFGSPSYLSVPDNTAFVLSGVFTLEAWVFPNGDYSTYQTIITKRAGDTPAAWQLNLNITTGYLSFYNGTGFSSTAAVPLNRWSHVAAVYDGTNINLYLDGIRVLQTPTTNTDRATGVKIGYHFSSVAEPFKGYISNVRVVKGVAVYTGNFTVPTSPLTATQSAGTNIAAITTGQTSLLTCQSNRFVDNGQGNTGNTGFTITVNGSPSVVAFFPFNPTASWSAATYGGSGYFDGNGDYLTVPYTSALQFTGNFTIEFWAYPSATQVNFSGVFNNYSSWPSSTGVAIFCGHSSASATKWCVALFGTFPAITSTNDYIKNAWSHIALVRNGTGSNNITLYVNGVASGTFTSNNTVTGTANNWWVGTTGDGATTQNFSGNICDFRVTGSAVYTSAFTPPTAPLTAITNTSLLLTFTNAGIYDATSKNDLETVGNAQISTAQSKWGGSSMSFDGTGDYLLAPVDANQNYNFNSGDFTVECWFYASTLSATNYAALMGCNTGGPSSNEWGAYVRSNGIFFWGNNSTLTGSAATVNTGTWNHFAASRSGNTLRLFLNGSQTTSATVTGTYTNSASGFQVGDDAVLSNPSFNGYLQDVRITKGYARYVEGTGGNAGKMVLNGTNTLALPTSAFPTL